MGAYALVEHRTRATHKNPIVACVTLHRLEGYFGSVDRTFGKPELIATDPVSLLSFFYSCQGTKQKIPKQNLLDSSSSNTTLIFYCNRNTAAGTWSAA